MLYTAGAVRFCSNSAQNNVLAPENCAISKKETHMTRQNPPAATPVSSQLSWGWLSIFALLLLSVVAFIAGSQPTTWFYPAVVALVVFLAHTFLEFSVVPRTATLEAVVSIGSVLVSLALLFGVFTLGTLAWWTPVVFGYVALAVVAFVRRLG
jgi:hypothetical protein